MAKLRGCEDPLGGDAFAGEGRGPRLRGLDLLKRLAGYKVRRCNSLHECVLCRSAITIGEEYHDGGLDRRAHVCCVKERLEREKGGTP